MRPIVLGATIYLLFLLSSCDSARKGQTTTLENDSPKTFAIHFIQNGKQKQLKDNQVRLKKQPFTIQVDVNDLTGVYLLADFAADDKFRADNEFDNLLTIAPKTMAEENFNKNNELYISAHHYSYWFYNPNMDWHRFNVVAPKENQGFIGTKEVKSFYIRDKKDIISIADAPDDLYLFFFTMQGSFELGYRVLQREYIKVKWGF